MVRAIPDRLGGRGNPLLVPDDRTGRANAWRDDQLSCRLGQGAGSGGSPGQVLGAIAAGDIRRTAGRPADAAAAASARSEPDDDLQFDISLTDEQEEEDEPKHNMLPPLY